MGVEVFDQRRDLVLHEIWSAASSHRIKHSFGFGAPLTVHAQGARRICRQPLAIDLATTFCAATISVIHQTILRVIDLAQPRLQLPTVVPFNLMPALFRSLSFLHSAYRSLTEWTLRQYLASYFFLFALQPFPNLAPIADQWRIPRPSTV